uniref:CYP82C153 n=1 Tax=Corydalis yanhusuo TaxID=458692 RepID=A0AA96SFQ8_9MAGN|nr:CYP82C153 [Corydalis yanhusuo]
MAFLIPHEYYSLFPTAISSTITIPFFTIVLFYCLISWIPKLLRQKHELIKEPPQPSGSWPVIGHLHLLAGPTLPHLTLGSIADKHGPIFKIRLGVRKAVVVSSWELAKECFTTHDRIFSTRPRSLASKILSYDYAMFGLSPYGPYWRELRRISMQELLSNSRLEMLKHVWGSEINMCLKELYENWSLNAGCKGVLVDMKRWFGDLTLNMTVRMVVGKRLFFGAATYDQKIHEDEVRRFQKGLRDFFRLMGMFVVSDSIPWLGWLDLGGYEKEMNRVAKEIDVLLQRWLDEHKEMKKIDGGGEKDFMGVLLEILDEDATLSADSEYDADTINKSTCLNIFLGGIDTTMVSLVWALALLLNNPHVLKKAQDELDIHVGKERQVDESDIKNLTYLQAIVKETMRLYPAGQLSAQREASEDCTLADYHVQAGTRLIVNLWKIHRDPRVWSDPNEFKPERFLTIPHVDMDVKGQTFDLIPFGSGRRSCPGASFALRVVHLTLAHLLQGFEFKTGSGEPVDMTEGAGLTNVKATPLEVMVTPRLSTELYAVL